MRFRKPSKEELIKDGKNFLLAAALIALFLGVTDRIFGGSCYLRLLTGFPCPACGFTRGLILFLKGDIVGSYRMHAMVVPVLFGAVLYVFCKYFLENGSKIWKWYGIIVTSIAIVYYIERMVRYFPSAEPVIYYPNNLVAWLWRMH